MKALRLLPWLLLLGCTDLLQLEPAHLDPSIADTGAGGAGGGSAGETGQAGGAEERSLCDRYCEAMSEGCTGRSAQYTDRDSCLATCPHFPPGAPGDSGVNTLHCRLAYALKAPSEPVTYCTWAGPGGDGMCGDNCEGFCTLMTATCTANTTAPGEHFDSYDQCLGACSALPSLGGYSANDESTTGGADVLECRLYHVAAAIYADDAGVHCPHAMGLRLCVDR